MLAELTFDPGRAVTVPGDDVTRSSVLTLTHARAVGAVRALISTKRHNRHRLRTVHSQKYRDLITEIFPRSYNKRFQLTKIAFESAKFELLGVSESENASWQPEQGLFANRSRQRYNFVLIGRSHVKLGRFTAHLLSLSSVAMRSADKVR